MRWESAKAGYELEFENDFDGQRSTRGAGSRS
jgi:hypothetical protein